MPQGAPSGPQGIPPQVLAALAARQGGPPGGMPPGGPPPGPPMASGAPVPPPNPAMAAFGQAAQGGPVPPGAAGGPPNIPPRLPPPGAPAGPPQLAQQGRGGDTILAHLTPGEIEIPPQLLNPQVIALLRQVFAQAGLNPAQFTAGSPQAVRNPQTGIQQFNGGGGGEIGMSGGTFQPPGALGISGAGGTFQPLGTGGATGLGQQLFASGQFRSLDAANQAATQMLSNLGTGGGAGAPPPPAAAPPGPPVPGSNLPTFAGYDPIQAMTGSGFNFYPNRTLPQTPLAPG